jgi:hypothetical protein
MASQNIDNYVRSVRGTWVAATDLRQKVQQVDEDHGNMVWMDADQVVSFAEMTQIAQLTALNVPSSFQNASTFFDFRLVKGNYGMINELTLQFTVTNADGSNGITTVHPFFFLDHIEFWGNGGADRIQYLYPEHMLFMLSSLMVNDQQLRWATDLQFNVLNYNANTNNVPAGSTQTFAFPLLGNFITQQGGLYFPGLMDDFIVRVYLRQNVLAAYAGSTSPALTIGSVLLNVHYNELPSETRDQLMSHYKNSVLERTFLDTILFQYSSAYSAGSNNSQQLTAFIGLFPYFIWGLRSSLSSTNNAITTFTPIGNTQSTGTVEIDEPSGRNISGQTPWYGSFWTGIESTKVLPGPGTSRIPGLYPFALGDIVAAENRVIKKGMINFSGQEYLNIKPGSSAGSETAEVWTLGSVLASTFATATAATAGQYWIEFRGINVGPFAYNAAVTATGPIQTQLNQLLANTVGFNGQPIVATVGGNTGGLSNATPQVTVTLSNLPTNWAALPPALAVMGPLSNGTVALVPTATLTTAGVPRSSGFVNGTYTLSVWGRPFRHMHIDHGKFKIFQSY